MIFLSLVAQEIVIMTTSSATNDENFTNMTTLSFQWRPNDRLHGDYLLSTANAVKIVPVDHEEYRQIGHTNQLQMILMYAKQRKVTQNICISYTARYTQNKRKENKNMY